MVEKTFFIPLGNRYIDTSLKSGHFADLAVRTVILSTKPQFSENTSQCQPLCAQIWILVIVLVLKGLFFTQASRFSIIWKWQILVCLWFRSSRYWKRWKIWKSSREISWLAYLNAKYHRKNLRFRWKQKLG